MLLTRRAVADLALTVVLVSAPLFGNPVSGKARLLDPRLTFEPADGGSAPVAWSARGDRYTVGIAPAFATIALRSGNEQRAIRLSFSGAAPNVTLTPHDRQRAVVNYLIGNDESRWRRNLPTYARMIANGVYPGIDVAYYGEERRLEYDVVVAPGGDPSRIALHIDGAESVEVDANGNLVLRTGQSEPFFLRRPVASQGSKSVDAGYRLGRDGLVRFALGAYDRSKTLIIDPIADWSTYLGGSGADSIRGLAVTKKGEVVAVGASFSGSIAGASNSSQGGGADVIVAKFDATGARLFTTFFGGSGDDQGNDVAVDSAGNIYFTGVTNSGNYPTTKGAFMEQEPDLEAFGVNVVSSKDAFVTKLDPDGNPLYSTYLGSSPDIHVKVVKNKVKTTFVVADDVGRAIAVDDLGRAYIAGETDGEDFPTTVNAYHTSLQKVPVVGPPIQDGFAAMIDTTRTGDGSFGYGTYIGHFLTDSAFGVAVDKTGKMYVCGQSAESTGGFEAWAMKIDPLKGTHEGDSVIWFHEFSGGNDDAMYRIAVDDDQRPYVLGATTTDNYLGGGDTANKFFVARLHPNDGTVEWTQFFGFHVFDAFANELTALRVRSVPGSSNAFAVYNDGSSTVSVTRFDNLGTPSLVTSLNLNADALALAVNSRNVFFGGTTVATNLPDTANTAQPAKSGSTDGFVRQVIYSAPPLLHGVNASGFFEGDGNTSAIIANYTRTAIPTVFTVAVSWGDGTPTSTFDMNVADGGGSISAKHAFPDNGVYNGRLCVTEEGDPTPVCTNFTSTVANVPPTLTLDNTTITPSTISAVYEGVDPTSSAVKVTLNSIGSFTDPGILDTHHGTIDWGDGTAIDTFGANDITHRLLPVSHAYSSDGTKTATVCAIDKDGGSDCKTLTIVVPKADLAVTLSGPNSTDECNTLDYTIHVANNGPDAVQNVNVIDRISDPAHLAVQNTLPGGSGATINSAIELQHDLSQTFFGGAVAAEGNTVAVGSDEGVTVYERSSANFHWNQTASLVISRGATSIAIHRDWMAVGTKGFISGPTSFTKGFVTIFHRVGGAWTKTQEISPTDATDTYGQSVAISDAFIAVGDSQRNQLQPGAAYLYRFNGTSWDLSTTLHPPAPVQICGGPCNQSFGTSVALDNAGVRLAVGAPDDVISALPQYSGSVFVYEFNGTAWTSLPGKNGLGRVYGDPTGSVSQLGPGDFGRSVALNEDGSRMVIGAPQSGALDAKQGKSGGAILVSDYPFNAVSDQIFPSDAAANSLFGISVGITGGGSSGSRIIAGTQREWLDLPAGSVDRAYVFTYFNSNSFSQTFLLQPNAAGFGTAVAISGFNIVGGATEKAFAFSSCLSPGAPGVIQCNIGTLNPGQSADFSLSVKAGAQNPGVPGPITHSAKAFGGASDPNVPNSSSVALTFNDTAGDCSRLDVTPPAIQPVVTGVSGSNGWYLDGTVSLTWSVTDVESPITSTSGCDAQTITTDTAGTTFTCTATSPGGTASASITLRRDSQPPSISASANAFIDTDGSAKTRLHYTCADIAKDGVTSGIAVCPADVIALPGAIVTATAKDVAGNSADLTITIPQADAGPDATITTTTCNGAVTVSGSGGGTYEWFVDGVSSATTSSATFTLPTGVHHIVLIVTAGGVPAADEAIITVVNNTAPVFENVSPPITVEQTGDLTPATVPTPSATSGCGTPVVTGSSPGLFPPGTTYVLFTATDSSGNVSTASVPVTVNPHVDLQIARTDANTTVSPGGVVEYDYRIENHGLSTATGIQLKSAIGITNPTFQTYTLQACDDNDVCNPYEVISPTAQCAQDATTGQLTCSVFSLAPGQVTDVLFKLNVPSSLHGDFTDTAVISSNEFDANPADNSVTSTTHSRANVDVSLQDNTPAIVTAGTQFPYKIIVTHNFSLDGQSDATGIALHVDLPSTGVTFVSTSIPCSRTNLHLDCPIGTLALFATTEVDVNVDADADLAYNTVLAAHANVTTADYDPYTSSDSITPSPFTSKSVDLEATLIANAAATAGADYAVSVKATNHGPSTATSAQAELDLPYSGQVTFGSAPGNCTFVAGASIVKCTIDRIDVGASATVPITLHIDPALRDPFDLSAGAISDASDPNFDNTFARQTIQVLASADLEASGSIVPPSVNAGGTATINFTATNHGPSSTTGTLLLSVPAGGTVVTPVNGCNGTNGKFTCDTGLLAPGGSRSFSAQVNIDPSTSGDFAPALQTIPTDPDPNADNDKATLHLNVIAQADLSLALTAPPSAIAGTQFDYTMKVSNGGPSPASNVSAALTLAPGSSFVSGTGCTAADQIVTCTTPSLASSASQSFTVTVSVDASARGTLAASAVGSSATPDADSSNNTATGSTEINTLIDVAVAQNTPASATPGLSVMDVVTVSNSGPSAATGVTVAIATPQSTTVADAGGCQTSANGLTCNAGTVQPNTHASFTILYAIDPAARGQLPLNANASSTEIATDADHQNDASSAVVNLIPQVDVSIKGTSAPDPVIAGSPVALTITATNAGPSQATAVVATATLPTGITYSSSNCTNVNGTVTCTAPKLDSGQSAQFQIQALVDPFARGALSTSVSVSATEAAANNGSPVLTGVTPQIDAGVDLRASSDPVVAGQTLTYTMTLSNSGISGATNVAGTLTIGAGASPVTAAGCTIAGQIVTCQAGSLPPAGTRPFTIVANVASSSRGSIQSKADVTAAELAFDTSAANNSTSVTTTIATQIDVAVSVQSAPPAIAGSTFVYTSTVSNAGPSDATAVVLTETIPAGATLNGTPAGCSASATAVTCGIASLSPGGSQSFAIPLAVDPGMRSPLVSAASVTSAEQATDTNTSNNSVSLSTPVQARVDLAVAITAAPDPVVAGTALTYTVKASNGGPSNATLLHTIVTLPAGVSIVSSTCSGSGLDCTTASLTPGASASFTINVTVDPYAREPLVASATVSGTETEADPSNNTANASTDVSTRADVSIAMTGTPNPVVAGNFLTYDISLQNDGPSGATGVTVALPLPQRAIFAAASSPTGSCAFANGVVTCMLANLNPGASTSCQIRIVPTAAGTYTSTATVTAAENDPDPSNNAVTVVNNASGQAGGAAATGDLDGDGDLDVAVVDRNSDQVVIFLNDGRGNFTEASRIDVGHLPASLAIADLNGDGFLDIAAANSGSTDVSVLLNDGTARFTQAARVHLSGNQPSSIAVGDFDGDGRLDLAVAKELSADVSIVHNGVTGFSESANVALSTATRHPLSIAAGDLDGDGALDLAVANDVSNSVAILHNDGRGGFSQTTDVPLGSDSSDHPRSLILGDLDGDNRLDIAVANQNSDTISILHNSGTEFTLLPSRLASGKHPVALVAGDFDGNSMLDLASANADDGSVSIFVNSASGFGSAVVRSGGTKPFAIVAGDFNGDGRLDLVVANDSNKPLLFFLSP